ncbi:MAG: hypothetical protein LBH30_00600 [Prevotellaceae bacterium]|jgi:Leucine-rich repeat (LRR) protein|nr:hypothetical protein [Prevotellaceae bacterium]
MKKIKLMIAAVALLMMAASCSKDDHINHGKLPTIQFTFTNNQIVFAVTVQSMTIDWGDGTTEEYTNLNFNTDAVSHPYASNVEHTVRIYANDLSYFQCYNQQLTALDVSNNTALTYLDCGRNPLGSLNVSNNTALTWLGCFGNQLRSLDVSNNTALTYLDCGRNPLVSLDVSNNTALTWLGCFGNQLDADALNKIFTDLPTVQSGDIYINNNPGIEGCDRSIATVKNWNVVY